MDTSNINPNTDTIASPFIRPNVEPVAQVYGSMEPNFSFSTNVSNDLTILGIQLLIRGYGKTSLNYNLGMTFPDLINQKIYFPFKVEITIDDLIKTIGPSTSVEPASQKELITLFTTPELISEVIKNAKQRIIMNYPSEKDYNNYIVQSLNQSIQKGIIKNNLNLINELLFLNNNNIFFNKRKFVIDESKELKPQINDFKDQISKKKPINSTLMCNGILFVSPILEEKKLLSSITRPNLNLVIRGQRKGIVKDYNVGMSFPSLKNKTLYFPFTIKLNKKNLIKALDLNPNVSPTNNDLITVFTKPGLLRLAIRDAIKSGEKSVSSVDEAVEKNIIKNNLELINEYLFAPKNLITIYSHTYTIHSSEGIVPEINIFKSELIQRKSPLLIKLKCNVILNVLDTASASDIEFKRLSCQMRKDLIIQDLEEILGTEIERDIKKDIKYLKRAPKISKYDYYKKKGLLYPEYQSGYFPYYPGYIPPYLSDYYGKTPPSLQKTQRRRKPITESIYRRGPVTTSAFTTQRPSTASTLDTFTSPESLSPSRFEEKPTSKLERELEKQRYFQPYPYPYGMYPYQQAYTNPKITKKKSSSKKVETTSPYPVPYGIPYGMMAPPPFFQYQTPSKKIITNKTRRILKGGKKYNKTIKNL